LLLFVVAILFSLHQYSFSAGLKWPIPVVDVYAYVAVALEHDVAVSNVFPIYIIISLLLCILHLLVSAIDLGEESLGGLA